MLFSCNWEKGQEIEPIANVRRPTCFQLLLVGRPWWRRRRQSGRRVAAAQVHGRLGGRWRGGELGWGVAGAREVPARGLRRSSGRSSGDRIGSSPTPSSPIPAAVVVPVAVEASDDGLPLRSGNHLPPLLHLHHSPRFGGGGVGGRVAGARARRPSCSSGRGRTNRDRRPAPG